MFINDNIKYIDINNTIDLPHYFEGISELFLECFGKPLDRKLWEWAYINNPSGPAIVSLAITEGRVIGHYAAIPMPIENSDLEILGYLSMTTMVSSSFVRYKLFQLLANRVFDKICITNRPSIIFGFPNNNSVSGFRKRLGWTISEEYKIVELTKETHQQCIELLKNKVLSNSFTVNLNDPVLNTWRLTKPSQEWDICNGIGIKEYDGGRDLMYMDDPLRISDLVIEDKINVILPIGDSPEHSNFHVAFPYRFGYRLFNCENIKSPDFFVQMCMSDVF